MPSVSASPSPTLPVVLAIDPGFDRIGWAVGMTGKGSCNVMEYGCIETNRTLSLAERYLAIDQELTTIITTHHPQALAIEQLFFSKNQTTALKVSEARGVILSCAARQGLQVFEYLPQHIKLAVTGYGRADKKAMEKMIRLQLKLSTTKLIDDTIDALGVLLTHSVVGKP